MVKGGRKGWFFLERRERKSGDKKKKEKTNYWSFHKNESVFLYERFWKTCVI